MLWPDGKPQNWPNFSDLLKPGSGVESGCGTNASPIMIHIDKGGNQRATNIFSTTSVPTESTTMYRPPFYPWWHGSRLSSARTWSSWRTNIKRTTCWWGAYCWRPTQYKTRNGPFPESPEGQKEFLDEVHRIVLSAPNNRGIGIFWWEPAVTGGLRSRGFFDDDGNALPVINVFDRFTRK